MFNVSRLAGRIKQPELYQELQPRSVGAIGASGRDVLRVFHSVETV